MFISSARYFSLLEHSQINVDLVGTWKSTKSSLQHCEEVCIHQYLYFMWEIPILMQLMPAILTADIQFYIQILILLFCPCHSSDYGTFL